jgi:mono/diheme cytochrome c family protein
VRRLAKIVGVLGLVLLLAAVGVYGWASWASSRALAASIDVHAFDFPIPPPLQPSEIAALGLDEAAARQLAQERAIERGRHLVTARYACVECHGENFGGGVMVDAFPLGRLLGPNLTSGEGSRTREYQPRDWDRIVRHGVLPDGRLAVMPSEDFQLMSDQELGDIIAYIRSMPPVDNVVPQSSFGPLGKLLVATGQLKPSATLVDHNAAHAAYPPPATASAEFGRHLAGVCTGCHGPDLSGGPIPGGDPSWPPARNLTPDPTGLGGWTYDQFVRALRESQRPDGTPLREPMALFVPYANNMTDVELQALWAYLRSVPAVAIASAN